MLFFRDFASQTLWFGVLSTSSKLRWPLLSSPWINLPRYPAPPLPGPTIPSRAGLPDIKPPDDLSVLITSVCCGELETMYLEWGSGYRREDRRGSSPIQGLRLSRSPSNRNVGQRYSKPPLPPRGMAGPRFLESCRIDYQRSMGLPRQSPV